MVDAAIVAAKLGEIEARVGRLQELRPRSVDELIGSRDRLDLVCFNLFVAVQSCLDLASHVIADAGWAPPATMGDSFRVLAEHGVIAQGTAEALARAAGFRNVVAHGYATLDASLAFTAATDGLDDLQRFAGEVASWVRR